MALCFFSWSQSYKHIFVSKKIQKFCLKFLFCAHNVNLGLNKLKYTNTALITQIIYDNFLSFQSYRIDSCFCLVIRECWTRKSSHDRQFSVISSSKQRFTTSGTRIPLGEFYLDLGIQKPTFLFYYVCMDDRNFLTVFLSE